MSLPALLYFFVPVKFCWWRKPESPERTEPAVAKISILVNPEWSRTSPVVDLYIFCLVLCEVWCYLIYVYSASPFVHSYASVFCLYGKKFKSRTFSPPKNNRFLFAIFLQKLTICFISSIKIDHNYYKNMNVGFRSLSMFKSHKSIKKIHIKLINVY